MREVLSVEVCAEVEGAETEVVETFEAAEQIGVYLRDVDSTHHLISFPVPDEDEALFLARRLADFFGVDADVRYTGGGFGNE